MFKDGFRNECHRRGIGWERDAETGGAYRNWFGHMERMEESEEYKKGSQMRPEGGLDLKGTERLESSGE